MSVDERGRGTFVCVSVFPSNVSSFLPFLLSSFSFLPFLTTFFSRPFPVLSLPFLSFPSFSFPSFRPFPCLSPLCWAFVLTCDTVWGNWGCGRHWQPHPARTRPCQSISLPPPHRPLPYYNGCVYVTTDGLIIQRME